MIALLLHPTVIGLGLLGMVLLSGNWTLSSVIRSYPVGLGAQCSLIGMFIGWMLVDRRADEHLPHRKVNLALEVAFVSVAVFGLVGVGLYLANMLPGLVALLKGLWSLVVQLWIAASTWRPELLAGLDLQPVSLAAAELQTLQAGFISRLSYWLSGLRINRSSSDVAVISLVWSCLQWLNGLWAGRALQRGWSLGAVAPIIAVAAFSLKTASERPLPLLMMIGLTLGLITVGAYRQALKDWIRRKIDYASGLGLDIATYCFGLVLLVTSAGLVVNVFPDLEVFRVYLSGGAGAAQDSSLARSLGVKQPTKPPSSFVRYAQAGLPRQHLIGSRPDLDKQIVLSIQLEFPAGTYEGSGRELPSRPYWKQIAYDVYTGSGWSTTTLAEGRFDAEQALADAVMPAQIALEQHVRWVGARSELVPAAGELVEADHPLVISWRPYERLVERGPTPAAVDRASQLLDIFAVQLKADEYHLKTLWTQADFRSLRNSGGVYPEWVRQRYLPLPAELPERVRRLAEEIIRDAPDAYTKAEAIQKYLRQLPYTLDLSQPPDGRDVVDYFLFDLRRGYCDYYASAMVVMARSVGVPARLVVGYARGKYDPVSQRYLVSAADAHSWVEVYFPDIGWVIFEPTASLPEPERMGSDFLPPDAEIPPPEKEKPPLQFPVPALSSENWILLAGIALVAGGLISFFLTPVRLSVMPPDQSVREAFLLAQYQAEAHLPEAPSRTALESVGLLDERLRVIGQKYTWLGWLRNTGVQFSRLAQLYNRSTFSSDPGGGHERGEAVLNFIRLRLKLLIIRLLQR